MIEKGMILGGDLYTYSGVLGSDAVRRAVRHDSRPIGGD